MLRPLLLGILSLFCNITYACTSFGNSILFHVGVHILGAVGLYDNSSPDSLFFIVFYVACFGLEASAIQSIYLYKLMNRKGGVILFVPLALGSWLGIQFLSSGNENRQEHNTRLRFLLGCVFCFVGMNRLASEIRLGKMIQERDKLKITEQTSNTSDQKAEIMDCEAKTPTMDTPGRCDSMEQPNNQENSDLEDASKPGCDYILHTGMIFSASMAGVLGGLFGTPGPPLMMLASWPRLGWSKEDVRATLTVVGFGAGMLRMILMILKTDFEEFTSEHAWTLASVSFFSPFGLIIGNMVSKYVDMQIFVRIIIVLLLSSSISLLLEYGVVPAVISFFTCVLLMVGLNLDLLRFSRKETKTMPTEDSLDIA